MKKIVVGAIFLLALFLRMYKLNVSPPGLYADETSIGYNAYSILKTGKDEHGVAWPVFFRAFGEYKNPVFIYSLVPLISLKGLSPETVRLGAAIWGGLAILLLILTVIEATGNFGLACLSGLVLTIMPWHIHFSRIGFEAITFPTLLLLALLFWFKWLKKKKIGWGIGFGLILGLSFYSYTTARLWIPLILIILLIVFRKKLAPRRQEIIVLDTFGLMLIPVLFWLRQFPGSLMARMNQISIWNDYPTTAELVKRFLSTYAGHLTFSFLFSQGDRTLRHSSGISSEMLLSFSIFLIIGLILIIKKLRKKSFYQLNLFMIALFPLAASLTRMESSSATRTVQVTPFMAIAVALGIWWCLKKLKRLRLVFIIGTVILVGLEFSHYYYDLIYEYPKRAWKEPNGFAGGLGQTIQNAYRISQAENKQLYLSNQIDQTYIQGLFFTQADPKLWQERQQAPFEVKEPKKLLEKGVWVLINNGNYKIEDIN